MLNNKPKHDFFTQIFGATFNYFFVAIILAILGFIYPFFTNNSTKLLDIFGSILFLGIIILVIYASRKK